MGKVKVGVPKVKAKGKAKAKAVAASPQHDPLVDGVLPNPVPAEDHGPSHPANVDYLAKVEQAWSTIIGHELFQDLSSQAPYEIEAGTADLSDLSYRLQRESEPSHLSVASSPLIVLIEISWPGCWGGGERLPSCL